MHIRKFTAILLAVVAFAACSEPVRTDSSAPVPGTTRVTLLREGSGDVAVYAFRRQGEAFLYDTLFRDGWTADGRLRVRLKNGDYKFLFASGAGDNLVVEPSPLTRQTAWEDVAFALREDGLSAGSYLPADELFLQYPSSDANSIYSLDGTDVTVSARLTRAVCRIGVSLKRGYRDGDRYKEEPYAPSYSILEAIQRIELTAERTGLRVSSDGVAGEAAVRAVLPGAEQSLPDEKGFVRFDGPFILPSAAGTDVELTLRVVPAADASVEERVLHLTGAAERNKRLEITLWITSAYPEIGIEIRTTEIGREQIGDTGIWE